MDGSNSVHRGDKKFKSCAYFDRLLFCTGPVGLRKNILASMACHELGHGLAYVRTLKLCGREIIVATYIKL